MITRARLLSREGLGFIIQEGNWILIHYISPLGAIVNRMPKKKKNIKANKQSHSARLVFNNVPDIFSYYCQCLSESGIVILEITWCLALPLRSPEWNLWFGSCVSFSWNFGLSHIWFLRHTLLLNRFLLFLTCFRHCSFLHAWCLIVL